MSTEVEEMVIDCIEGWSVPLHRHPYESLRGKLIDHHQKIVFLVRYVGSAEMQMQKLYQDFNQSKDTSALGEFHKRNNAVIEGCFEWFAVTLIDFIRIVKVLHLMRIHRLTLEDISAGSLNKYRTEIIDYIKKVALDVYKFRNKIAAHNVATDPRKEDTPEFLELFASHSIGYGGDRYVTRSTLVSIRAGSEGVEESRVSIPHWSLTQKYDELTLRFGWPKLNL